MQLLTPISVSLYKTHYVHSSPLYFFMYDLAHNP